MDLDDTAARLGVPVEEVDRVHRLAGDQPSAPLPAKAEAPAILDRLAVSPDDAAEVMACGVPARGSVVSGGIAAYRVGIRAVCNGQGGRGHEPGTGRAVARKEIKQRGGIRGSSLPARRLVAPAL